MNSEMLEKDKPVFLQFILFRNLCGILLIPPFSFSAKGTIAQLKLG